MSHANAKCAGCGAHRFEHFGVQEYCHASDYERATNGETFSEEAEPVEQVTMTAGVAGAIRYAQVPESVSAGDAPCATKLAIATERIAKLEAALGEYAEVEQWWQAHHVEQEPDVLAGMSRSVWAWNDMRLPWQMARRALGLPDAEEPRTP